MVHLAVAAAITLIITATQSEHSRDSSTQTTRIEVGKALDVVKTRSGHGPVRAPERAHKDTDAAASRKIEELVGASGLVSAKSVDQEMAGYGMEYDFVMEGVVGGKPVKLRLHGPAKALEGRAEYQAAVKLVEDLDAMVK